MMRFIPSHRGTFGINFEEQIWSIEMQRNREHELERQKRMRQGQRTENRPTGPQILGFNNVLYAAFRGKMKVRHWLIDHTIIRHIWKYVPSCPQICHQWAENSQKSSFLLRTGHILQKMIIPEIMLHLSMSLPPYTWSRHLTSYL